MDHRAAPRGAAPTPYWPNRPERPDPLPRRVGDATTDLVVVGGGYTGLWTAPPAKRRAPGREVLPLEQGTCGHAAAGRVGYALGFTGPGVGATRFGAQVVLDLLEGRRTERTELSMIRRRPVPFPPEPVRRAGIRATRWSMAREDARGRRDPRLRTLDRLGPGFDS